jgi:hypothetical protein
MFLLHEIAVPLSVCQQNSRISIIDDPPASTVGRGGLGIQRGISSDSHRCRRAQDQGLLKGLLFVLFIE